MALVMDSSDAYDATEDDAANGCGRCGGTGELAGGDFEPPSTCPCQERRFDHQMDQQARRDKRATELAERVLEMPVMPQEARELAELTLRPRVF